VDSIIAAMRKHPAHFGCVGERRVWASAAFVMALVSVCRWRAWSVGEVS
jgi:hypothetical protein